MAVDVHETGRAFEMKDGNRITPGLQGIAVGRHQGMVDEGIFDMASVDEAVKVTGAGAAPTGSGNEALQQEAVFPRPRDGQELFPCLLPQNEGDALLLTGGGGNGEQVPAVDPGVDSNLVTG
jgi:hypothetical protein